MNNKILFFLSGNYYTYDLGLVNLGSSEPSVETFLENGLNLVQLLNVAYEEFYVGSDSVDILYYTDNSAKTTANLEITANYSPLDEIEGDYEVVTWTDEENAERILAMNALPVPQFIKQINPISIENDISNFISTESGESNKKYLLSPDQENWMAHNGTSWVTATTQNQSMTAEKLSLITPEQWNEWQGDVMYLGIYLDGNTIVDRISYKDSLAVESTKISDAKLYILNTVSTIDVSFAGSTITGLIDDEDEGKVQYRILLNGENHFPMDGEFTPLMASPLNISSTLSNNDILIDQNNTLRIEFKDYWGSVDYWEANFVGSYSGLLFMDESNEYYSTDIGEILKYLDFGVIIAGQTTIEQAIKLRNTYGYAVDNVRIRANQSDFPVGMSAVFGTSDIAFEGLPSLTLEGGMNDGDERTFYIRLTSQLGVTPEASGKFDIIVTADKREVATP